MKIKKAKKASSLNYEESLRHMLEKGSVLNIKKATSRVGGSNLHDLYGESINKAAAITALSLANALGCQAEDLLEHSPFEIDRRLSH